MLLRARDGIERLKTLPTSPDRYGLIHADLHYGNFFCTEDSQITAFDFDDAAYHWFAYDLAVAFNALPYSLAQGQRDHVARAILAGYRQVRSLPQDFQSELRMLLELRDIQIYQLIHKKNEKKYRDDKWLARATSLARRIRSGEPTGWVTETEGSIG